MQKLLRDGSWVKRERSARRPIDFRLDTGSARQDRRPAEGGVSDDATVMTVLTSICRENWARGPTPARPDSVSK